MPRRSRRSPSTEVVDTDPEESTQDVEADQLHLFVEEETILRQHIPTYILGNRSTRPAIVTTATTSVKDARKNSGHKPFTKSEIRALPLVIRGYLEEHCPDSLTNSVHSKGGRKWSIHSVVQRILAEEVRVQKNFRFDEYKLSAQYAEDLKAKGQPAAIISFQAAAVQDVIASLSAEEVARYNELAKQWTVTSPPAEAQRENAEKKFVKTMESVTRKVYTQMGARVFMLAAYTDTSGNLVTIPLDFSEVVGETSFYKEYQDVIENSEVYASFEKFAKTHFKAQKSGVTPANPVSTEHIRPGVRALMALQKTPYGEPIMLAPHRPPSDMVLKQFLTDLLRSTMSTLYSLARGTPTQRVAVPWKMIKSQPRNFVSEKYLTPMLLRHWGDPSQINLDDLKAITHELYNRQRKLRKNNIDAPFFWFHAWYDKVNEVFVAGYPRTLQVEVTQPDRPDRSRSPKKSVTWGSENGSGEENAAPVTGTCSSEPKNDRSSRPPAEQSVRPSHSRSASPVKRRPGPVVKTAAPATHASSSLHPGLPAKAKHRSPSKPFPPKRKPTASQHIPAQRAQSSSPRRSHPGVPPAKGTTKKHPPQLFPPQRKVSRSKPSATQIPYPVAPLSTAYRSPVKDNEAGNAQRGRSVEPRRTISTPFVIPSGERAPVRRESQYALREEPVARRTRSRSREPDDLEHRNEMEARARGVKGKQRAVFDDEEDGNAMDVDEEYDMDDGGFQAYDARQWAEAQDRDMSSEGQEEDQDEFPNEYDVDDEESGHVNVAYEEIAMDDDEAYDDDDNIDNISTFTEEDQFYEEDHSDSLVPTMPVREEERRQLHSPAQSRAMRVPRSAMRNSAGSGSAGSSRMAHAGRDNSRGASQARR